MNLLAYKQVYEILNMEVLLDKINPLSPYGMKEKGRCGHTDRETKKLLRGNTT